MHPLRLGLIATALAAPLVAAPRSSAEQPTPWAGEAPTGVIPAASGSAEVGARAKLERRWAPEMSELERQLEQLGKQQPKQDQAIEQQIVDLKRRVDTIQDHVREVSARIEELRATRPARRTASLGTLERRWGKGDLAKPSVRAELATHARRSARLNRAIEVARDATDDASLARAKALRVRENARHADAMARLVRAPAPAGSE